MPQLQSNISGNGTTQIDIYVGIQGVNYCYLILD